MPVAKCQSTGAAANGRALPHRRAALHQIRMAADHGLWSFALSRETTGVDQRGKLRGANAGLVTPAWPTILAMELVVAACGEKLIYDTPWLQATGVCSEDAQARDDRVREPIEQHPFNPHHVLVGCSGTVESEADPFSNDAFTGLARDDLPVCRQGRCAGPCDVESTDRDGDSVVRSRWLPPIGHNRARYRERQPIRQKVRCQQ